MWSLAVVGFHPSTSAKAKFLVPKFYEELRNKRGDLYAQTVRIDPYQEIAARILTERDLLALPVVDEAGRLLGIITADDVITMLRHRG